MPGDLYIGGGVYIPIEAGVDYWPVVGVTEPQHHWPFVVTGDYTDQGSTGGFTLTEGGSGNSFSAGLVLNGSGRAVYSHNDDLCDLGATFSLLFDATITGGDYGVILGARSSGDAGYCIMYYNVANSDLFQLQLNTSGGYQTCTFSKAGFSGVTFGAGTLYQQIVVLGGGYANAYCNGVAHSSNPVTFNYAPLHQNNEFIIGAYDTSQGYPVACTIARAGILKGTAWSADDVAAIYAAL